MRDHGDAHALELRVIITSLHAFDKIIVENGRPVHTDKIPRGVITRFLTVARQAAITAVGAATFRIGHQNIQTMCARCAIHAPADKF